MKISQMNFKINKRKLFETSKLADFVCPDHNFLESWGDANPKRGHYSLQQPTINPIFAAPRYEGTRQVQDTLLKWSGVKSDYLTYLQGFWNNHVFSYHELTALAN